ISKPNKLKEKQQPMSCYLWGRQSGGAVSDGPASALGSTPSYSPVMPGDVNS
ncbi:hypothetical protein P7K49_014920, partial [Saguinus oedipus]